MCLRMYSLVNLSSSPPNMEKAIFPTLMTFMCSLFSVYQQEMDTLPYVFREARYSCSQGVGEAFVFVFCWIEETVEMA